MQEGRKSFTHTCVRRTDVTETIQTCTNVTFISTKWPKVKLEIGEKFVTDLVTKLVVRGSVLRMQLLDSVWKNKAVNMEIIW